MAFGAAAAFLATGLAALAGAVLAGAFFAGGSTAVTLAIVFDFSEQLLGLLLGGTMVAMLGLFDDLRVIPPARGSLLARWLGGRTVPGTSEESAPDLPLRL